MNEEKRRGRPPKSHLHEDHHFRTSDEVAAAVATPAVTEADQADATGSATMPQSTSAEQIAEAVVENPTIVSGVQQDSGTHPELSTHPIVQNSIGESPIEEKIHQLVDNANLNGWHPIDTEIVIEMPPRNGMGVRLSEFPEGEGVLAVWKKTRKFANTTHRWQESGKWVDFHSGMDITFQPKYWKERF